MPRPLDLMSFVLADWTLPSPGQQLLDRFLMGYPKDGRFHQPGSTVRLHLARATDDGGPAMRARDFKLQLPADLASTLRETHAAVVAWPTCAGPADASFLQGVLEWLPEHCPCFVAGPLASTLEEARQVIRLAQQRDIPLMAGGPLGVTWRLPQFDLPKDAPLTEALIVVQGDGREAAWNALDAILPLLRHRAGGESGLRAFQSLEGAAVWEAGTAQSWSWDLLAAALSRSDSPQGDAVRDGRTQDLVGLGLVPTLAQDPRAWLVEHEDGLRTTVLLLNGVVADINFAVRTRRNRIYSAQIYRPPSPQQHEYSRLAEAVEHFFRTNERIYPIEQSLLQSQFLEAFAL